MKLRGRISIALTLSLDAVLFSYLLLLLANSSFQQLDVALFAPHLAHVFTILLAYFIVHYSQRSHDALRLLVLIYLVAFLFDSLAVVARIIMYARRDSAEEHHACHGGVVGHFLRVLIGSVYVVLDLCGAFFADMTRATVYMLAVRTDEQLQAIALEEHRRAQRNAPAGDATSSNDAPTATVAPLPSQYSV